MHFSFSCIQTIFVEIYKHEWHKKVTVNTNIRENAEFSINRSVTDFFIVKEMIQGNLKDTSVKLKV